MLLNPSQYSPQGLMPQFAGPQAGTPQMGPGFFGQPGAFGGNGQAQQPFGAQQSPFAGQPNPFQPSSFQQSPFQQSPFALNPYLQSQQSPYLQSQLPMNPLQASGGFSGVSHPAQQIVQILAHLAQQILTQSALGQQIGASIQQLAQVTVQ
ncbi:MAG TPA: hypothetical protein VN676_17175, partial [Steroidobacteraceae bacterium]|nr:hypothetical protein [Steroidobacteraceae bacterium]